MKELSYLRGELADHQFVERTEITDEGVLKFDVNCGVYDSLSSEIVSILGRYDCSVYPKEDGEYWAIAP